MRARPALLLAIILVCGGFGPISLGGGVEDPAAPPAGSVVATCVWSSGGIAGINSGLLNYGSGTADGDIGGCLAPTAGQLVLLTIALDDSAGGLGCFDVADFTAYTDGVSTARSSSTGATLYHTMTNSGTQFVCQWDTSLEWAVAATVVDTGYTYAGGTADATLGSFGTPDPPAVSSQGVSPTTITVSTLDQNVFTGCPATMTKMWEVSTGGVEPNDVWGCYIDSGLLDPGAYSTDGTDDFVAQTITVNP